MTRYARAVLAIVFAGAAAHAVADSPAAARRTSAPARPSHADALAQYGFRLTESAKAAGIDFVHQAPTLDPKLAHIMPQVASMGAAVSVVDFDRDGWPDLYVTNSSEGIAEPPLPQPRRRHVRGRRPSALGVADLNRAGTGVSMGAVWGDYDNDGFEDLFLYKWGRPELFHNDGGQGFTRVTDTAGLPAWVNANSAVWLDYDRDGLLDLFVGGYYAENDQPLASRRHADDAGELRVREQRRPQVPVPQPRRRQVRGRQRARRASTSRRWALAAVAADLRGTGYPDLFIANDYGVSELFANDGGKRFREVGKRRRRRLRAQERDERVGRRRASTRAGSRSTCRTSPRRASCSRATTSGCRRERAGGDAAVREPGPRDGRRPRRLELRRAVRRPEQRRLPRPVPGQRLRLGARTDELLVRLLEDRRRQPARHLRRAELAGDGQPEPGGLPAEEGLDQRRRRPLHRRRADGRRHRSRTTAASVALADLSEPRRARRGRRQPERAAAALQERRSRPAATGSGSTSRAVPIRRPAAVQQPQRHRRAGRACSGTASSRCRKSPAAAASARRTSAACTSAWAAARRVEKAVVRWPSGKTQTLPHPEADRVHKVEEPA